MSDPQLEELREAAAKASANDNARLAHLEELWRRSAEDGTGEIGSTSPATITDVWNCYRLLLNRAPDPVGTPHHLKAVRDGITIHQLVERFVFCREHLDLYPPPRPEGPIKMAVDGTELHLPAPITAADMRVRMTGRYKPHLAGVISSILKPGMYVLDLGAGAGEFAIPAARKVKAAGHVVAVDAHPDAFRALLANVIEHDLANVDCLPFAVADGDGFLSMMRADGISTARDVALDDLTSPGGMPVVYARTLDSIIPPAQKIDVVKIALDGFDHRAVVGASKILAGSRPHLLAEYAPDLLARFSGIEPGDYLRLLRQLGYTQFIALPPTERPRNLGGDIDALAVLPAQLSVDRVDFYAWTS